MKLRFPSFLCAALRWSRPPPQTPSRTSKKPSPTCLCKVSRASGEESPKLVSALTGGGFDVTYRLARAPSPVPGPGQVPSSEAIAGRFHAIVTAQGAMVSTSL